MPPAYEFRGKRNGAPSGFVGRGRSRPPPEHEFSFRSRPMPRPRTATRPLLELAPRNDRGKSPELVGPGGPESTPANVGGATQPPRKFRRLDEISDSDETDMDVSDDDAPGTDGNGAGKGEREPEQKPLPPPPQPKWSNPDPYTVLPPEPVELPGKKKDVVKMIRKAKVEMTKPNMEGVNPVTANDDFISFDFDDLAQFKPPEDAPTGPRDDRGRKRKFEERDGMPRPGRKPERGFNANGSIIDKWVSDPALSPTPWLDVREVSSIHPDVKLHKEILQFYDWVRPRPFEQVLRNDLIRRLGNVFQRRHYGSELHGFGSFASGIYLPVADMDLVLLSKQFIRDGRKTLCQRKSDIWSFSRFIKDADLAVPGSIETIAGARVPIIKFIDKVTGLRIDLSFDNDTGIIANRTFQTWRKEYPAMPVIVSVIKQFLLFRGLNEVPTGGLGGFSVICLVTSLLQMLPYRDEPHATLGSMLVDFFDFYGNYLDHLAIGIQFDPPEYFKKYEAGFGNGDGRSDRLAIIDPNNSLNDISGGTKEILLILKCFASAYRTLKHGLVTSALAPQRAPKSLLGSIIGGNYAAYDYQREHLQRIFDTNPQFDAFRPPPPPSSSPPPPPPPPPSLSKQRGQGQTGAGKKPSDTPAPAPAKGPLSLKKQQASVDRAARLQRLRPELVVPAKLSMPKAMELGGYGSQSEMDRDLFQREKGILPVV